MVPPNDPWPVRLPGQGGPSLGPVLPAWLLLGLVWGMATSTHSWTPGLSSAKCWVLISPTSAVRQAEWSPGRGQSASTPGSVDQAHHLLSSLPTGKCTVPPPGGGQGQVSRTQPGVGGDSSAGRLPSHCPSTTPCSVGSACAVTSNPAGWARWCRSSQAPWAGNPSSVPHRLGVGTGRTWVWGESHRDRVNRAEAGVAQPSPPQRAHFPVLPVRAPTAPAPTLGPASTATALPQPLPRLLATLRSWV